MPDDLGTFQLLIHDHVKSCLDSGNKKNDVLKAVMDATYDALFNMTPEEANEFVERFKGDPAGFRQFIQERFIGR